MTATPADVQGKLDAAVTALEKATTAPATMVAKHGTNPAAWPTGSLKTGFLGIAAARAEVGQLVAPSAAPTAAFTYREL